MYFSEGFLKRAYGAYNFSRLCLLPVLYIVSSTHMNSNQNSVTRIVHQNMFIFVQNFCMEFEMELFQKVQLSSQQLPTWSLKECNM